MAVTKPLPSQNSAKDRMPFTTEVYGPVFQEFLETDRKRPLGDGSPNDAMFSRLQSVTINQLFAQTTIVDDTMARCCLSGLWLLYDFLNESHTISQSIATAEGSFWHGIMHRREGDFSNAKYWFRKVGPHDVYERLAEDAVAEVNEWDPFDFVDACAAAVRSRDASVDLCQLQQQREWELLFDFCYQQAVR